MKKLLVTLLLVSTTAFSQTSGPTIHEIMRSKVAPNADALFSLQGKDSIPDSEWAEVLEKISTLHDIAHELKQHSTVPQWKKHVDAIDMLSERAIAQAQKRNLPGLADTGNRMFNVCMSCHNHFFPKGKNL